LTNKYSHDAILFDFDGVIMDSEPVHFDCWQQVMRPFGIEMDWDRDYQHIVGVADYVMIEYFAGRCDPPCDPAALWAKYELKCELFIDRMVGDPPVAQATRDLLAELDGQIRMAIVSSSGSTSVAPLLEAAGLRHHFELLVCREHVERPKPDPQPYLIAASKLGASAPLVVEDSESGAASGRAAGFDVLQVRSADEVADLVREKIAADADSPSLRGSGRF
jgi:beta-phosphoglucomutase-like phosphatase (HAD superfamily)